MTTPNIPAALARLALARAAAAVPEDFRAEMQYRANAGGVRIVMTIDRYLALVDEVIAWRNLADRRDVPPSLPEPSAGYLAAFGAYLDAINVANTARAATDKAFGG